MPAEPPANTARQTRRILPMALLTLVLALPTPGRSQDLPADPECLTIVRASTSTYTISNTACPEQSVMAAIELAGAGNLARCFVKKIRTQISIASEGAAPAINYQCIEGAHGCSGEIVRDMFPECHAG